METIIEGGTGKRKKPGTQLKDTFKKEDLKSLSEYLNKKHPENKFARTLLLKALQEFLEMKEEEKKEKYNPSKR